MSEESKEFVVELPGAVRKAQQSINGSLIWLYGEPKIGKTTFASKFPGVWFFATEKGQAFIDIREPTFIPDWASFLQTCAWIAENQPTEFKDGNTIRTLVIDTVDILFKHCQTFVEQALNIEDLGELPHGKGWARLTYEWERVMTKVCAWDYTVIFISHAKQTEFLTRGTKTNRWQPSVGAAALRFGISAADLILYAHSREYKKKDEDGNITDELEEVRVLQCHPQSSILAGGRMVQKIPSLVKLDYPSFISYFPDTPTDDNDENEDA